MSGITISATAPSDFVFSNKDIQDFKKFIFSCVDESNATNLTACPNLIANKKLATNPGNDIHRSLFERINFSGGYTPIDMFTIFILNFFGDYRSGASSLQKIPNSGTPGIATRPFTFENTLLNYKNFPFLSDRWIKSNMATREQDPDTYDRISKDPFFVNSNGQVFDPFSRFFFKILVFLSYLFADNVSEYNEIDKLVSSVTGNLLTSADPDFAQLINQAVLSVIIQSRALLMESSQFDYTGSNEMYGPLLVKAYLGAVDPITGSTNQGYYKDAMVEVLKVILDRNRNTTSTPQSEYNLSNHPEYFNLAWNIPQTPNPPLNVLGSLAVNSIGDITRRLLILIHMFYFWVNMTKSTPSLNLTTTQMKLNMDYYFRQIEKDIIDTDPNNNISFFPYRRRFTNISTNAITKINVTNPGIGYTTAPNVVIIGVGSGATATATITSGRVTGIIITNGGSGYVSSNVRITITGGGGSGAIAGAVTISPVDGSILAIAVSANGSGYTSVPTVTITTATPGSQATAVSEIQPPGKVTGLVITNGGSGYGAIAPSVLFNNTGTGGSGATATFINGVINQIVIINPGSGYTSNPSVVITGPGSGAVATAQITNGQLSSITVITPGSGYTTANIILNGGGGIGATALPIISNGFIPNQSILKIDIDILNPGAGYGSPPNITIGGPGLNAQAYAILEPFSAIIDRFITPPQIINPGSGYIRPPFITDNISLVSGGTRGVYQAIITGGQLTGIEVISTGSGYQGGAGPYPLIITGGGGTGAIAQVSILPGKILSIVVANSGSGYTVVPSVTIDPPYAGGIGPVSQALATAVVSDGVINAVTITNGGSGYMSPPLISFGGTPTVAATAIANIIAGKGTVTNVQITNAGSGYSTITPPVIKFIGGSGSGAAASAVVTPAGGILDHYNVMGYLFLSTVASGQTVPLYIDNTFNKATAKYIIGYNTALTGSSGTTATAISNATSSITSLESQGTSNNFLIGTPITNPAITTVSNLDPTYQTGFYDVDYNFTINYIRGNTLTTLSASAAGFFNNPNGNPGDGNYVLIPLTKQISTGLITIKFTPSFINSMRIQNLPANQQIPALRAFQAAFEAKVINVLTSNLGDNSALNSQNVNGRIVRDPNDQGYIYTKDLVADIFNFGDLTSRMYAESSLALASVINSYEYIPADPSDPPVNQTYISNAHVKESAVIANGNTNVEIPLSTALQINPPPGVDPTTVDSSLTANDKLQESRRLDSYSYSTVLFPALQKDFNLKVESSKPIFYPQTQDIGTSQFNNQEDIVSINYALNLGQKRKFIFPLKIINK